MQSSIFRYLFFTGIIIAVWACPLAGAQDTSADLKAEIKQLREQLNAQKQAFQAQLEAMEARLNAMTAPTQTTAPPPTLQNLIPERSQATEVSKVAPVAGINQAIQSMNPDISVIVDTYYHADNSDEGISHVLEEIRGFGHSHGGDDHGHEHAGVEDGFNLRHLELHFSAEVDPYFRGWAIGAISEEGAELEEAVIQTTCLPGGLQLQAGKFFSNFGRLNAQHSHEWEFVDRPLIYQLTMGDHGLNEKGVQLSWLAPTPFYLLAGIEAFQGDNDVMFSHLGGEHLPDRDGPRTWIGWLKVAPNLSGNHAMQAGLFGGRGIHQEEHDGFDNTTYAAGADGEADHWLDGHSTFWGVDLVYKYDCPKPHGQGDIILQAEYLCRKKDLELYDHVNPAAPVGNDRTDEQDGYYIQGTYGFLPRWRCGLRWEQIGLTNESTFPDGSSQTYDDSYRLTGMLDFSPSEFSRLRLQLGRGVYDAEDGREGIWEMYLQWMISLGSHGAHSF